MLLLNPAIQLQCANSFLTLPMSLNEKILGNYMLMAAQFTPKDLLLLLSAPLATPPIESGMNTIDMEQENSCVQNIDVHMVNHLINRMLLSFNAGFNYQDTVYITVMLQKLGIKDVSQFMSQMDTLLEENKNIWELSTIYHEHGNLFSEIINMQEQRKEYTTENNGESIHGVDRENNRYLLHQWIYNRLDTANIYSLLANCQQNSAFQWDYLMENELKIAEQLRMSKLCQLSYYKQSIQQDNVLWARHVNQFEMGLDESPNRKEAHVYCNMAKAILSNLVEQVMLLRVAHIMQGQDFWIDATRALSQSAQNGLSRYLSYHQENSSVSAQEMYYTQNMNLLYKIEIDTLKALFYQGNIHTGCRNEKRQGDSLLFSELYAVYALQSQEIFNNENSNHILNKKQNHSVHSTETKMVYHHIEGSLSNKELEKIRLLSALSQYKLKTIEKALANPQLVQNQLEGNYLDGETSIRFLSEENEKTGENNSTNHEGCDLYSEVSDNTEFMLHQSFEQEKEGISFQRNENIQNMEVNSIHHLVSMQDVLMAKTMKQIMGNTLLSVNSKLTQSIGYEKTMISQYKQLNQYDENIFKNRNPITGDIYNSTVSSIVSLAQLQNKYPVLQQYLEAQNKSTEEIHRENNEERSQINHFAEDSQSFSLSQDASFLEKAYSTEQQNLKDIMQEEINSLVFEEMNIGQTESVITNQELSYLPMEYENKSEVLQNPKWSENAIMTKSTREINEGEIRESLTQVLSNVNQQNKSIQEKMVIKEEGEINRQMAVPDITRTFKDAYLALENPIEVLAKLMNHEEMKTVELALPTALEMAIAQTDESTRKIYEEVLLYEKNPAQALERGILKQGSPTILQQELLLLEQQNEAMEGNTQTIFQQHIERLEEMTDKSMVIIYQENEPGMQDREYIRKTTMIHKPIEGQREEELMELLRTQIQTNGSSPVKQDIIMEATAKKSIQNTELNEKIQETVMKTTEDMGLLIERTLAKQMAAISDRVYSQMERKLLIEKARRGRF